MKYIVCLILALLALIFTPISPAYAAMVKADDSIFISEDEKNLSDVYLFGNMITVDASIENDLLGAGKSITVNNNTSGSIMTAGSDVVLRGGVGNTVRAAGENVIISGSVKRDVLIAAGNSRITKEASISGDLLFFGGKLQVDGPINGNVRINGADVIINSTINGNVSGEIGELTLGKNAKIQGNLTYSSPTEATIERGATTRGTVIHQEIKQPEKTEKNWARAFAIGALFKLVIDILACFILLNLFPMFIKRTLEQTVNSPLSSLSVGFIFLFFWPIFSLFLLLLLWLGLGSFLFYGIIIILSLFITKFFVGWWILQWWEKRNKKEYSLDWRVVIVGPLALFILLLIPVIGWIIGFFLYLLSIGGIIKYLIYATQSQRNLTAKD